MKRILFLGSTGFLGSAIYKNIKKDYKIIQINYKKKSKNKIILKDIKRKLTLIEKFKPNIIIDFAWYGIPHFTLKNSIKNIKDKIYFYDLILKIKSIKKIIIAGSCLEYMNRNTVCFENDNVSNDNYLNWAKLSIKNYISNKCKLQKINLIWLRIFYAYGEGQRNKSLIPYIINSINSNKLPKIKNMNHENDFIHKNDISALIKKILIKKIKSGVYNVGTGKSISVGKVCDIIYKIFKLNKPNFNYSGKKIKFLSNINKINRATGWKPKIVLNEKTIKNLIKNEKYIYYN